MTAVQERVSPPVGAAAEKTGAKRRSPAPLVILGLAAVAGAVFGWRRIEFARHHVTSDNAQVDGHITGVAPRVSAFVGRVFVDDNQAVKAGDTLVVLDDRDLRIRLQQTEADLRSAEAAIGNPRPVG